MNQGLLRGLNAQWLPPWLGGGDPANDGKVVTANSSVQGGVSLMQPSQVLIASSVLAAAAASVTFSSIPGTYNHLQLTAVAQSSDASTDQFLVQFNGDTAGHYGALRYAWNGSGAGQSTGSGMTSAQSSSSGDLAPNTGIESSLLVLDIPYYANTTFQKICLWNSGFTTQSAGGTQFVAMVAWNSSAAITSMKVYTSSGDNFIAGSAFYLYGIT